MGVRFGNLESTNHNHLKAGDFGALLKFRNPCSRPNPSQSAFCKFPAKVPHWYPLIFHPGGPFPPSLPGPSGTRCVLHTRGTGWATGGAVSTHRGRRAPPRDADQLVFTRSLPRAPGNLSTMKMSRKFLSPWQSEMELGLTRQRHSPVRLFHRYSATIQ